MESFLQTKTQFCFVKETKGFVWISLCITMWTHFIRLVVDFYSSANHVTCTGSMPAGNKLPVWGRKLSATLRRGGAAPKLNHVPKTASKHCFVCFRWNINQPVQKCKVPKSIEEPILKRPISLKLVLNSKLIYWNYILTRIFYVTDLLPFFY